MKEEYFIKQILLPKKAIVAIKLYCVRRMEKLERTYMMSEFHQEVLDFLEQNTIRKYQSSCYTKDPDVKGYNLYFHQSELSRLNQLLDKANKLSQEPVSERQLLFNGIIRFLKRKRIYSG